MKSALEIALEKTKHISGEGEQGPLTEEQKTKIAGIRKEYEAKIAQEEIMMKSEIGKLGPAAASEEGKAYLDMVREKFASAKTRLTETMEKKIDQARSGK